MNSPFTEIADELKSDVIDRWLAAKVIDDEESGWDLVESDDEWGIYTVREVVELGHIAGIKITFSGIELSALLTSHVITEIFDDEWISKISGLEDVYVDLVLDYIESCGLHGGDCIKIVR
jgi:hypothetical protein